METVGLGGATRRKQAARHQWEVSLVPGRRDVSQRRGRKD